MGVDVRLNVTRNILFVGIVDQLTSGSEAGYTCKRCQNDKTT